MEPSQLNENANLNNFNIRNQNNCFNYNSGYVNDEFFKKFDLNAFQNLYSSTANRYSINNNNNNNLIGPSTSRSDSCGPSIRNQMTNQVDLNTLP